MMDVEELNSKFSFSERENSLQFEVGKGGIPIVKIHNFQASAVISLQGAQILSWKPTGEDEVIWLSRDAVYTLGKPVRGGIPICWPWFGAHESEPSFPSHGFVRNVLWEVVSTEVIGPDETEITFRLRTDELDVKYQKLWPQSTVVEYRVSVGKELKIRLSTFNRSDREMTITQALHTYFNIDDIGHTRVYGLEEKSYLDKTEGNASKRQEGPVTVEHEVDRIYLDVNNDLSIDDGVRKIMIKQEGSRSSVVWNPWKDVAKQMPDLEDEGYRKMLCVETANVADDVVKIEPNEGHCLQVSYNLKKKS